MGLQDENRESFDAALARANELERQKDKTVTKTYIANLTDEQLRKLAREKLSEALQAVDATKDRDLAVRLSNAVLDRAEGKPMQRQQSMVAVVQSDVNITFVE